MNANLIDLNELLSAFKRSEFVLKTQRQIAKDFGTAQYDFGEAFLTENFAYETIIDEVKIALSDIMKQGETVFLQLMYTIDVKESDFLVQITGENFLENIAQIIIRREAYKVYLREQFS